MKGFTNRKLAELIDKDEAQVSHWINDVHTPYKRTINKICEVLGVSIQKVDDYWELINDTYEQDEPAGKGQVKEPITPFDFSEREKRVSELVRKLDSDSTAPPSPDDVVRILEVAESLIRSAKELLKSSRDPSSGSDD